MRSLLWETRTYKDGAGDFVRTWQKQNFLLFVLRGAAISRAPVQTTQEIRDSRSACKLPCFFDFKACASAIVVLEFVDPLYRSVRHAE